jgi:hypothetical protein
MDSDLILEVLLYGSHVFRVSLRILFAVRDKRLYNPTIPKVS